MGGSQTGCDLFRLEQSTEVEPPVVRWSGPNREQRMIHAPIAEQGGEFVGQLARLVEVDLPPTEFVDAKARPGGHLSITSPPLLGLAPRLQQVMGRR